MTEKLRNGVNCKDREAIQQSVARIVVGVDGSLKVEAIPVGPLGAASRPDGTTTMGHGRTSRSGLGG